MSCLLSEGDSLDHQNTGKFSTPDQDNDVSPSDCAELSKGGWWYRYCHTSNLNGLYYNGDYTASYDNGVVWYHWKGWWYSLKFTEMKIRPSQ